MAYAWRHVASLSDSREPCRRRTPYVYYSPPAIIRHAYSYRTYQVQGQLAISERAWADFVVWTPEVSTNLKNDDTYKKTLRSAGTF